MLLILNYLDMHIEIRSKMRHPESDQICCCQKHRDRLKKQTKILVSCIYKNFPPKKNTDTLLPRRFHLSQPLSFYHLPAKILVSCSHLSFVPKLLQNSLLFQQHLSRESSLIHSVSQYWISLILQVWISRCLIHASLGSLLLLPELLLQVSWHCVLLQVLQGSVTSATAKLEALDIEQSNKVNPFHSFTNYLHLLKKHEKPKCPISFSCDRMRDPSLINCCSDISKPSWHCREG